MDNILASILGSANRAKLLRLFVSNPDTSFSKKEIEKKLRSKSQEINKILNAFVKIKLLSVSECKDPKSKRKSKCYKLNNNFDQINNLRQFVLGFTPADDKEIVSLLSKAGSIKLALLSGVFLSNTDSPVDILIVSDNIKEKKLEKAILEIESYIGKEIRFALFNTDEFKYRVSLYDKLLREFLDKPYKVAKNSLGDFWKDLSMIS